MKYLMGLKRQVAQPLIRGICDRLVAEISAVRMTAELWSQNAGALADTLSPEQIAGRMRFEQVDGVCPQRR